MLQSEHYEYKLFILRKERREEEMRDEREGSHKIKIKTNLWEINHYYNYNTHNKIKQK